MKDQGVKGERFTVDSIDETSQQSSVFHIFRETNHGRCIIHELFVLDNTNSRLLKCQFPTGGEGVWVLWRRVYFYS